MIQDLDYKVFDTIKAIALKRIGHLKVYWNSEELFQQISKPGLEDAAALLRVFEKQIKEHNSKLDADEARIKNLHYKSKNAYQSIYFKGINANEVLQVVKDNPYLESWEIAMQFEYIRTKI